jgi:hypothetical protein
MPCHPKVNNRKSNKLPSSFLLCKAKDIIFEWWDTAYSSTRHSNRFITEAKASLPIIIQWTNADHFELVFSGIQNQRMRLKTYQQLTEWDG